jgi:S-adenosylmethionine hydrolase
MSSASSAPIAPATAHAPAIALLTDFGTADGYVGVMKGVLLGIAPGVALIDLTHDIPPQDIREAAWVLHTSWRYFPAGTIFLCVVDPGVGTGRRPVALRADGRVFVGPDNGLFSYVLAATEPEAAVTLDDPRHHLPGASATFHGRDIFSPCAAHLAAGVPLAALGSPLDPASLIRLAPPRPTWDGETLRGRVLHVDRFGNLITSVSGALATAALTAPDVTLRLGTYLITDRARTFASGPEQRLFVLLDSSGHLAIALRNGSAAAYMGAGRDDEIAITGLHSESSPPAFSDENQHGGTEETEVGGGK